jgi:S1-C subfamily serine protease
MKRTLIEIAAVGSVLLLMSVLHTEIRSLQSEGTNKQAELEELREIVQTDQGAMKAGLVRSVETQNGQLGSLERELKRVQAELDVLHGQVRQRTTQAEKQAIEAMGQSRLLSRTVESNERTMRVKEQQLRDLTQGLRTQIEEQRKVIAALRSEIVHDFEGMTQSMLSPTIQLSGDEFVGSGTVISSRLNEKRDGYDTFVLTAWHVVRNILNDQPELRHKGIDCTIYTKTGNTVRLCDVVAKRESCDLALLKMRGRERVAQVAQLIAPNELSSIRVWTPVYAVGCPLGNDPIPTGGFVANLASEINGSEYWMINAPTYFGNSGGGIYNGDTHQLIAVFSKIYTHGRIRPVVIPHMGLAVPMDQIFAWLRDEDYGFLIPGENSVSRALAAPSR